MALQEWLGYTTVIRTHIHEEWAAHFARFDNRPGNECLPTCDHCGEASLLKPRLFLRLHAEAVELSPSLCSENLLQLSDNWPDSLIGIDVPEKAASNDRVANSV